MKSPRVPADRRAAQQCRGLGRLWHAGNCQLGLYIPVYHARPHARARKPSKSAIPDHNPSWRSRPQPAKSAETGVTPLDDRARLLLTDLEPLAIFLCGPRWQTALARRINRSPRLVRRWVAGDRPISMALS